MREITQTDYIYKTTPFDHQDKIFRETRDLEFWALFLEQGTGKSKIIIDTAAWLYMNGKINFLLVSAPNGVHFNWIKNEIADHLPDHINYKTLIWDSEKSQTKWYGEKMKEFFESDDCLKIFVVNIDAVLTKRASAFIEKCVLSHSTLGVIDESQDIKSPSAKRTKAVHKLRRHIAYRRILTGTPITQGPLDIYSQIEFLDPDVLGFGSFYSFRNRYAIMVKEETRGGQRYDMIVGYRNLDELYKRIQRCSTRLTKDECLDLPDKLYQKCYVDLSPAQKRLYNELRDQLIVEFEGIELTAQIALVKLLRLQQITGGFFPVEDPESYDAEPTLLIEENGPREKALIRILSDIPQDQKAIIWCKHTAEIKHLEKRIRAEMGKDSVVTYFGETSGEQRMSNVDGFQKNPKVRFFVGQPKSGGTGLTLHAKGACQTVIYFSNDYSLNNRLQSEDRAHRIGQTNNVTYIDIIARETLDERVVRALRDKKGIANLLTGDPPKNWI